MEPRAITPVYNGESQALVSAGTAVGGTILKTAKALHLTLAAPYGVRHNSYKGCVQAEVSADDLFALE